MANKTVSATVDESNSGRVDVIVRELTETSRSQVRGLVQQNCVTVNGSPCKSIASTVAIGDVVMVCYDPHTRYREKKRRWEDRTFSVVFEDDHLIVVDKSSGVLTIPSPRGEPNSLIDRVSVYLSHSKTSRHACLVHRLDRAISGLLVFGKHEPIAKLLVEQFKDIRPKQTYAAIVQGNMATNEGTYHSHLATAKNLDRYETRESKDTEEAITNYRVVRPLEDTTLIEATTETARRHQIRVQLASAGHPVLGDPRYKKKDATHPRWIRNRIALHVGSLGFFHPVTGDPVEFESPYPRAMQKFIAGSKAGPW